MRTIALINQKGGVGKTTSVVNIASGLIRSNRKVLVVDLDPQAHLTYSLGIAADELDLTVYDLLRGETTLAAVALRHGDLSIIPASIELAAAEVELSSEVGREALLKNRLGDLSVFDFVLVDCPPNLGLLTLNALTAVREVFVPLQAEFLSIKGLQQLQSMISKVTTRVNPHLKITGLIATLYDKRLNLHQEVFENMRDHFGEKLFTTVIRRNVALAEASSFGKSIFDYSPRSHGAQDYRSLCNEILNME